MADRKIPQASAPMTVPMSEECFQKIGETRLCWLGSGGIYINARGTRIMIDPVLEADPEDPGKSEAGFELLVPSPIHGADVPELDAVLYTHADYDHMAKETTLTLMHTGASFWGTAFTCRKLQEDFGIPKERTVVMDFDQEIILGNLKIHLTPASHAWQKNRPEFDWYYGEKDCCGFYMETPDGTIWAPGDSLLLPEHFQEVMPDVMFWDISSDAFHFGTENSLKLANHYENSHLILYHYGTYYAPHKPAFNADPRCIEGRLKNPERLHELAPGEMWKL